MAATRTGGLAAFVEDTCAGQGLGPVVRLFHWTVVAGCTLNLFILEPGHRAHRYVGYTILTVLAVRLVWGLIGTHYARFASFFPTPKRLLPYVQALARAANRGCSATIRSPR